MQHLVPAMVRLVPAMGSDGAQPHARAAMGCLVRLVRLLLAIGC